MVNEVKIKTLGQMTTSVAIATRVLAGEESLKIISRTAHWRIDISTFPQAPRNFKLGNWNWSMSLKRLSNTPGFCFNLSAKNDLNMKLQADFVLRIAYDTMSWQSCLTFTVEKQCFQSGGEPFKRDFEIIGKRFVIEVEFLNMEVSRPDIIQLVPETPASGVMRVGEATKDPLMCLSRMFTESIHTDVIINTKNGSIGAHIAILAASSPVFASMFDIDLKEKLSSTVDINDMSYESCKTFLSYFYGDLKEEDLWTHRVALLDAAHKYGILKLQNMCEDCLTEDINLSNVIERLLQAHLYELKNLKQACFIYLFDLGKVTAISDDFSVFLLDTDPILAKEVLKVMISK